MKIFFSVVVISMLTDYTVCAQYRKMTNDEMLARTFKAANVDISEPQMLHAYMERFDRNYPTYERNEFELKKNEVIYKNYLQSISNNINEQQVFYGDVEGRFNEYDFNASAFKFSPFPGYEENGIEHKHVAITGIEQSYQYSNRLMCAVEIRNLDFVNGLKMESARAKAFLDSRTTENYGSASVDRRVYIRIYYAAHADRTTTYQNSGFSTMPDQCLFGEPLRVEVWADKCRVNNLIAVYFPGTNSLSPKFSAQCDLLRHMTPGTENYAGHIAMDNYKNLMVWSQINDDCDVEKFEVHIKLQKTATDQKTLLVRLFTNYNYTIRPGFTFTFYNRETNIEYPLVIAEAAPENGAAPLKIKVTNQTIYQIVNSNCYSFKMQLNGNPKYQLPGGGVSINSTEIKRQLDEANFNLGSTARQTLFNTLQQ